MRHSILPCVLACALASTSLGQVYTTPEKAKADPDFDLQGEYADTTRGLQVIALGDGEFQVVTYTDGLPGAGWNGKDKKSIEIDADALESMLDNFERVDRKSPTLGAKPPGGAVVLFDGTKESLEKHWRKGAKITEDGLLQQGCTSIEKFGDYVLHLEFRTPFKPTARGQGRGNSGLYHQGRFETQILDSFGLSGEMNETGGIYSIRKPDLNMCLPPLAWQTYDVEFTSARFDEGGKKTANAKMTVKLNGVVIHRDVELPKHTTAAPVKDGPGDGPIYLQDHGNPVRFRNIWVLPRDVDAEARRPIVPGFERFHVGAGNPVDGGRLLLGELNCVACHKTDNAHLVSLIQPKQAPILDKVGERINPEWMVKYLANPHEVKPGTTMPDLLAGRSAEERQEVAVALTNFLVYGSNLRSGGKAANTSAGEKLFHESGCVACHLPRNGQKANPSTSVPLTGIEEKYTRASLEEFIKNPHAVRPSGRMPQLDLGGDNWRHIAQYLTGDESGSVNRRKDLPKTPNMTALIYNKTVDNLKGIDKLKPNREVKSRGLDISVAGRNDSFIISFRGFLPISTAGKYRFRIGSDDGSLLFIDGKKVLDNDGVHGVEHKEATIDLAKGTHSIRVDFFEKAGGEELMLDWSGPGMKMKAIDRAIVMSRDGEAPVLESSPRPTDANAFVLDASKVEKGRELFASLGCAACHDRKDGGRQIQSNLEAPALASLNVGKGCLSGSAQGIPNFDLTSVQSEALAAAISVDPPAAAPTADMSLVHTMKSLNCYSCHQRNGIGGAESDRNRVFVSTIPEMGDEGRLPPPLDGVGDKLRADWIENVIGKGNKSRPYMKTYMPRFGDSHGKQLAKHFASLDQRTEAEITETNEPNSKVAAIGRRMVGKKGLACISCHTFGKFKSTGIQAIALDTMAKRIREDWFHRYLPDPQRYRPGTRMPTGFPEGKSTVQDIYDGDQAKQLTAMWAFLEKGVKGGVPEGIVAGAMELKPDDKPVIYRNFISGVSPRGIAIGYPEKANLCWDADRMSLSLLWQDRFIDAAKHWVGRGQGTQDPLGGGVLKFEPSSPIAQLETTDSAWPDEPPRERGYQFLGYRLDEQGRPTFRYRTDSLEIADKPVPVLGELVSHFKREIRVTPLAVAKVAGNVYFRAAVGKSITKDDSGGWIVDDAYTVRTSIKAVNRKTPSGFELIVPLQVQAEATVLQEIIW